MVGKNHSFFSEKECESEIKAVAGGILSVLANCCSVFGITSGYDSADATTRMSRLCFNWVHFSPESSLSGIQDMAWLIRYKILSGST